MSKSITYQVTVEQHGTEWKLNDKFHREDGPACEYANGDKAWFINGKLHREDGPAVEYASGAKEWYINGEELTEDEFNQRINPVVEMTVAEIEALVGKRVKVVK